MKTETINLDVSAIAARLNELNGHDAYRFYALGRKLYLRDVECWQYAPADADSRLNPLAALMAMESADEETRNYGMPGIVMTPECFID